MKLIKISGVALSWRVIIFGGDEDLRSGSNGSGRSLLDHTVNGGDRVYITVR